MLKPLFFVFAYLILIETSGVSLFLFASDYGKRKRTTGYFSLETLPVYYEDSIDEFPLTKDAAYTDRYSPFSPLSSSQKNSSPAAYYQVDDYTTPWVDENWDNSFSSLTSQEFSGNHFSPAPDSPYYCEQFSVDDSASYGEEDTDLQDRLTYATSDPKGSPVIKECLLGWRDVQNLYSWSNAGNYGVMLGLMAIVANTSLDQQFIDWYQKDVRSSGTDKVSDFFKVFGEGEYIYPIFIGGALVGDALTATLDEDSLWNQSLIGEYFSRTARAEVIAVPVVLLSQAMIGASRPCNGDGSSHWSHPFTKGYGNGVSGHAYVGSIPFITLAHMSDSYWGKGLFYTMSTLPGLSRVNDNSHYLSQVILGWYLGYLSCRSVTETEDGPISRGLTIFPIVTEESAEVGLQYRF